ncbi:MAG TPA: FeoA family protein [Tepidisphaeraceae bacterium]
MEKSCDLPACDAVKGGPVCSLNQLGVGCAGTVQSVEGDRELKRRLLEMGFCNGVSIEVLRRAPLGDPIEFKLRGYCLSLRGEQAKHVQIQPAR